MLHVDLLIFSVTAAMWVLVVFFGAAVGSFLCVVKERGGFAAASHGRSHCVCDRQLTWWENIPLASWIVLGARARCCGARIPVRYVLWEVAGAALAAIVVLAVMTTSASI